MKFRFLMSNAFAFLGGEYLLLAVWSFSEGSLTGIAFLIMALLFLYVTHVLNKIEQETDE
ncbi:hypothetical protein ASJ33_05125 [Dehalococcoides mccartyi]|nr:hypothetical protein ASJ33_05125 [Dehalococcoides mccartyi]